MTNILVGDFVVVLLIFLRVIAAFMSSPIYSSNYIPTLVKIVLAAIIAYMIFLVMDKSNVHIDLNLVALALLGIKEVISGLLLGFALNMVFYGINYAGLLIGYQMNLTMATLFNPMEETSNDVIGQALYFLGLLVFLLINGHHYIITALAHSFMVIPLGKYAFNEAVLQILIKISGMVFVLAVKIAAPVIVSFFLLHIGEAIIARLIPQMQVFFVTQPLKILLGFILLIALVPVYVYLFKNLLQGFEDNLYELIKGMSA